MTRRKIELDRASPEWLKGVLTAPVYRSKTRYYDAWDEASRNKELLAIAQREFLSRELDFLTVIQVIVDKRYVEVCLTSDLSAREMNLLMNYEIHLNGSQYVFQCLAADTFSEGDYEVNSIYGCLKVTYIAVD